MTVPPSRASLTRPGAGHRLILSVSRRSDLSETDEHAEPSHARLSLRFALAVGVFWLVASLLTGTTAFLARRGTLPGITWFDSAIPPLVAGGVWIPLTLVVVTAARRYPPVHFGERLEIDGRLALAHVVASLSISFIVNGAYLALTLPDSFGSLAGYAGSTIRLGLAYLHFNAGAYWVLTLGTFGVLAILDRRRRSGFQSKARTLTVRSGSTSVLVAVSEIRWIEGAGDYVSLHLADSTHLLSERLKTLEKRLDPEQFVRVHRSAIVNVSAVRTLKRLGHGDGEARLDDGTSVRVSRTRRARLQDVLQGRELPAVRDGA